MRVVVRANGRAGAARPGEADAGGIAVFDELIPTAHLITGRGSEELRLALLKFRRR